MEIPADEDDKVRRNLVTFSAAVLLLAWLQVPLHQVLGKAGVSDLVPAWRAWSAAAAVLLWARFHYSGQGREFARKLQDKYANEMYGYLNRRLGQRPFSPEVAKWITPSPTEVLQRGAKHAASTHAMVGHSAPEAFFSGERWKMAATLRMNVQWIEGEQRVVRYQYHEDVAYRVPALTALRMRAKAVWFSWLFSSESLAWLFPVVLGSVAGAVIVWRLGSELLKLV